MVEPIRGEDMKEDLFQDYIKDDTYIPTLSNKVVAITGTTTGLGFHLARLAILKQARFVILLNRESLRSEQSTERLLKYKVEHSETRIETIACDLMDLESVGEAANKVNQIAQEYGGLDVLACNAGIAMMGDRRTKDGFDLQMQTNQLSHVLLIHLMWKSLKLAETNRGEARIVMQTSNARSLPNKDLDPKYFQKNMPVGSLGGDDTWVLLDFAGWREGPATRYQQSKLANAAFCMALHDKLQQLQQQGKDNNNNNNTSNIKVLVSDPGYCKTPNQTSAELLPTWIRALPTPMQSPADGCLTMAMCCFSSEANSGDLFEPNGGLVGPPIKVVGAGKPIKGIGTRDDLVCSEINKTTVWECSQKALDVKFFDL